MIEGGVVILERQIVETDAAQRERTAQLRVLDRRAAPGERFGAPAYRL
jgi:hypothetical protein